MDSQNNFYPTFTFSLWITTFLAPNNFPFVYSNFIDRSNHSYSASDFLRNHAETSGKLILTRFLIHVKNAHNIGYKLLSNNDIKLLAQTPLQTVQNIMSWLFQFLVDCSQRSPIEIPLTTQLQNPPKLNKMTSNQQNRQNDIEIEGKNMSLIRAIVRLK